MNASKTQFLGTTLSAEPGNIDFSSCSLANKNVIKSVKVGTGAYRPGEWKIDFSWSERLIRAVCGGPLPLTLEKARQRILSWKLATLAALVGMIGMYCFWVHAINSLVHSME